MELSIVQEGKQILDECIQIRNKQGKCNTGEAVVTTAGNLPTLYVIHTVGPVWNGDRERCEKLLGNCYKNALKQAEILGAKTIAFLILVQEYIGFQKSGSGNSS